MRERHTALLVVVTYLSSPAFVSPLIATKCDQLAPSPRLWALCGIVKTFSIGTNPGQSSHSVGKEREKNTGKREGDRKRRDSREIAGLRFKLRTAVVS